MSLSMCSPTIRPTMCLPIRPTICLTTMCSPTFRPTMCSPPAATPNSPPNVNCQYAAPGDKTHLSMFDPQVLTFDKYNVFAKISG